MIEEKDIEVKYMDKLEVSDHVPIRVKLRHEDWKWEQLDMQRYVKNKNFMRKISIKVLERLYLANEVDEIKAVFNFR